ncbi:MAG: hypothetical protein KF745_08705 [Phycisphaeraceae bacterium]|nr:hypothetical protein [Phycisphaeraceae bacterium]
MLPLIGTLSATITAIAEVSIHGDLYADAELEPQPAPGQLRLAGSRTRVRIPLHACESGRFPAANDRVEIELLMGQVTRIRVL